MKFPRTFRIGIALTVLAAAVTTGFAPAQTRQVQPEVQVLLDRVSVPESEFKWREAAAAALLAVKKAEEIGDVYGVGKSYLRVGRAYYRMGDLKTAKDYYTMARDTFAKIGEKYDQMGSMMGLATILDNTGRANEARPIYLEVLAYNREIKNLRAIASTLQNLAILEVRSDNNEAGIKYALEASTAFAEVKEPRWQAESLLQAATGQAKLGRYEESEATFREALVVARASGSKEALAGIYANLGGLYWFRNDFIRALEAEKEALRLHTEVNNLVGQRNVASGIGAIYMQLGQSEVGLEYLRKGVDIARKLENPVALSDALGNLGIALVDRRRFSAAKPVLQEALDLGRPLSNQLNVARFASTLGVILTHERKYDEALASLRLSLEIFQKYSGREEQATTIDYIGSALREQGKYPEAIAEFRKAIGLYAEVSNDRFAATSYWNLALTYTNLGKLDEAEQAYRTFVRLTEDTRARLGASPEGKAEYLGTNLGGYQDFIALLVRRGKVSEAFALAQKTKARNLVDLLNGGNVAPTSLMTPNEQAEERRLRLKADEVNAAMVREGAINEVGAKKRFAALKLDLAKVERELSEFTLGLYAKYPTLAQKRGSGAVTLEELGARLPEDTALLEFAGGKRSLLFVVTAKGGKATVKAVTLQGGAGTEARTLGHLASNPKSDFRPVASSLYQRIIAPVEGVLANKKRLVVCPEGAFWDLPFAALYKNGFLSERFDIAYAYSATAASAAFKGKPRSPNLSSVLVVANPAFGGTDRFGDNALIPGQRPIEPPSRPIEPPSRPIETPSRPIEPPSRDLSVGMRGGIVELPGTQQEANAIAALLPGVKVLSKEEAQESTVTKVAGNYRVVHIASHAFFNDGSPMLSSIILAKPNDASADGYLTAREIFDLKLNADMVVLSACNTARGGTRSGEGIIGLSWALLAAGAPAQVVSQWSVDDRATAVLMERFYRNLKSGQRKDQALKNAATSLRDPKVKGNDPKWRHPYYWAPFILLGDSR